MKFSLPFVAAGYVVVVSVVVVVADDHAGGLAFYVVEVLRRGAYDSILVDRVVVAEGRALEDAGVRLDDAMVADGDTGFDVGEGSYFHVLTQLGCGVNVC